MIEEFEFLTKWSAIHIVPLPIVNFEPFVVIVSVERPTFDTCLTASDVAFANALPVVFAVNIVSEFAKVVFALLSSIPVMFIILAEPVERIVLAVPVVTTPP